MAARTVIVGDVHGCLEELERLLADLALAPSDRLVMVGDLVAKGPASLGVLRLLRQLRAESVLGNHDANLLRHHREPASSDDEAITKLARKLDDEDWAWLEALPYTIPLAGEGAIVVHAGLAPGVPLRTQKPDDMLTMRSVRPDGTASKRLEDGAPWASVWPGPLHVYFGHDAVRGLQRHPFATGLDTACVYGGRLTACVLPGGELTSVKAKRAYAEPGKAIAARNGGPKKKTK
ncbi:MAG: metallophosphoesterase [Myxococcota bacterium]|nr:metallophosphoesterase [Myxococcota bacterium]